MSVIYCDFCDQLKCESCNEDDEDGEDKDDLFFNEEQFENSYIED